MANRKRLLVPESAKAVKEFKGQVMAREGFHSADPDDTKYEVAKELNVPLKKGDNGQLTSKQAGEVGGKIGGSMVKEMIRMAQQNLTKH
ncbi:small acid soluble protein [Halalkalibacter wakoensis JCM 9140]|uniref:Small acid soluble protein n=1 Tax=Halalkalibacter wakoensis JCM 9140 TaxID=1236970 RepID=W4PZP2_9BACI|nr:alpha/beta-type small acid-soluble spore protein [Halalkalibacter wakoensis]GAE25165.1 small acid soluble protein [Halalkalibacter wakoensis JCM 9140]